MKFVFGFLLSCCISASMQQHQSSMYDFWSYLPSASSWRVPNYYNPANYFSDYFYGPPSVQHHWPAARQPEPAKMNQGPEEIQARTPAFKQDRMFEEEAKAKTKVNPLARSGFLKLLGLDYLVNYVQSSLSSFTTVSTTTTYTTSTITVGTILTCYTKTMFKSTTACRRKRRLLPGLLVGDDGFETPSIVQSVETSSTVVPLSRETRAAAPDSFDLESSIKTDFNQGNDAVQLQSSMNFMPDSSINRYISQQNRFLTETEYIVTTIATTYSLYTTTVTKTVTNFASSTALTCLPACFVLC